MIQDWYDAETNTLKLEWPQNDFIYICFDDDIEMTNHFRGLVGLPPVVNLLVQKKKLVISNSPDRSPPKIEEEPAEILREKSPVKSKCSPQRGKSPPYKRSKIQYKIKPFDPLNQQNYEDDYEMIVDGLRKLNLDEWKVLIYSMKFIIWKEHVSDREYAAVGCEFMESEQPDKFLDELFEDMNDVFALAYWYRHFKQSKTKEDLIDEVRTHKKDPWVMWSKRYGSI